MTYRYRIEVKYCSIVSVKPGSYSLQVYRGSRLRGSTLISQLPDNKAYLARLPAPCGLKCLGGSLLDAFVPLIYRL